MQRSIVTKVLIGVGGALVFLASIVALAHFSQRPVAQDVNGKFKYVHVADLPKWSGNPETLSWVNPVRLDNKSIGILPDIKWGANKRSYMKYFGELMDVSRQPYKFSYDWSFESSKNGCLSNTISMRNRALGKRDSFTINQFHRAPSIRRYVSCLSHPAAAYYAVETQKHVALMTSTPGWVFYNKETFEFEPIVVEVNRDEASNLYISSKGDFLIDIQRTDSDDLSLGDGEKYADGIRSIF